jgi:hypothetical protein
VAPQTFLGSTKELAMSSRRNLTARLRFRPRFEQLENRLTPALGVSAAGPALNVQALGAQVNKNHTVIILDDGRGDITVTADGVTQNFTGIHSITVNGGNKKDNVAYTLTGDLRGNESLSVNLKQGSDTFTGIIAGNILGQAAKGGFSVSGSLAMQVDGGPGRDTITLTGTSDVQENGTLTFGARSGPGTAPGAAGPGKDAINVNFFTGTIAGLVDLDLGAGQGGLDAPVTAVTILDNVATTGMLRANLLGSTGSLGRINDNFTYSGQLKGTLDVTENGSAGNDSLNINVNLAAGSIPIVQAAENGFGGNDKLALNVTNKPLSPGAGQLRLSIQGKLDGGAGFDTATTNLSPPDVMIVNVP